MGKIYIDGQEYTKTRIGAYPDAKDQIFNNTTTSNISSENTQDALNELDNIVGNLNSLDSSSTNIVGIMSEFNSKISVLDSKAKKLLTSVGGYIPESQLLAMVSVLVAQELFNAKHQQTSCSEADTAIENVLDELTKRVNLLTEKLK